MTTRLRRLLVVLAAPMAAVSIAVPANAGTAAGHAPPSLALDPAPAWTHHAHAVTAAPANTRLRLTAVLPLRDAAAAERLALAVSTPGSAQYRKYLSPAQWRGRFAPSAADVATVTSWLKANGFAVTSVPANHAYVSFEGSTGAANAAFGVGLTTYATGGTTATAPSRAVTVPAALAGKIVGISGLDSTSRMKPTHAAIESGGSRQSPAAGGGLPGPSPAFVNAPPCSAYFGQKVVPNVPEPFATPLTWAPCGYTPPQLRSAYGTAAAQAVGLDGRGANVAIIDAYAAPTIFADAHRYASRNDPRHPLRSYQFSQLLPATFNSADLCGPQGWYGEETLDVEAVHAMAPLANILYVGGASCNDGDLLAAMNSIVDNGLAEIISNSYGNAGELPMSATVEEHQTYMQAAAQGISVLFSSGDSGDDIAATGVRQPDNPASDPFVTAVGGTSLGIGAQGQYLFETGWGTRRAVLTNGQWAGFPPGTYRSGGGGGTSHIWPQPVYQRGVVPPSIADINGNGPHRAVPDVAMLGDPNTGFLIGQTQSFPDGSVRYSEYRIGGTSLSCPLLAGVTAVTEQLAGGPVGFLNPKLYRLAGSPAFNDIASAGVTMGVVRNDYVNGVDASNGIITSLRTLNDTGTIFTRPGYDDVTGVGTPNGVAYLLLMAAAQARHGVGAPAH